MSLHTSTLRPPMARHGRWILNALALCTLVWAGLTGAIWQGQEHLLFKPEPLPASEPICDEPDVTEHVVEVPGARLSVLQLRRPHPDGVVFFLHGNNANLKTWFLNLDVYRRANMDLVMMDYRGYGKSSGRIESETQLHADVEAVWQTVAPRYAGKRVVAYGRSLGTGLAAVWAARHQPDLTILVSPYASMRSLAQQHYPWVPMAVLRYPLQTDEAIGQLRHPLLLIHGEQDQLIPIEHSRQLVKRGPQAHLIPIQGAGHADVHQFDAYQTALFDALRSSTVNPPTEPRPGQERIWLLSPPRS